MGLLDTCKSDRFRSSMVEHRTNQVDFVWMAVGQATSSMGLEFRPSAAGGLGWRASSWQASTSGCLES